ncbi:restriction endonuclease subunit S [Tenacibaculum insulae]|uniref:restriction endonuclease subunit S n=1 Tax=Tenacibaculum insulae TaxID=2029677 RepID=UPI003AB34194
MINKFKDSRLGKIPKSWEVVQLEDVCIPKQGMRRGPFGGAIKKAFFVEKGYQVYEQRNAIYDDFETARYFIEEDKYNELKAFKVEANDFIVSCSGTIGRIAKVPENFKKGVINQALLRLRLDRNIITDNYFLQQFRSEPFQNKITDSTQGGAMRNLVGMAEFRKTLLTLPPLPEQQKIAEILSTVDAKIDVIDQRIAQTQDLKKGLMQRLLTKGIGHTEFKESPLGEIPKSWEVKNLDDFTDEITDYVAAGSFASLKENVNVFTELNHAIYVRLTDLRKGLGHSEQKYVDEKSYNFLSKSNLYGNEILFANIGANVGEAWMMPEISKKATIAPNMIVIRANNKNIVSKYLHAYLSSSIGLRQIDKIIAGSGHPKINKTELRKLSAILPPKEEQTQIANILSTVDAKLDVLQNKKTHYQDLKKGLMQQLLTGKVRVTGLIKERVEV